MGSVLGALGGGGGSGASRQAAIGQQGAEFAALKYLKKQNRVTDQLRNAAANELGGIYGLPGFQSVDLTGQAENSPIYKAMVDQINQGLTLQQNQTGSSAASRGLLGSGTLSDALAKQQAMAGVSRAGALSSVYQNMLGGVQGMAQMPTNQNSIAQLMQNIGQTYAQGILGSAQSGAASQQAGFGNLGGLAQLGMQAYNTFYSDIRLKDNVKFVGEVAGHNWYSWDWSKDAEKLGLKGRGEGVMAHEVEKYAPEAIGEKGGYMTVNYDALMVK